MESKELIESGKLELFVFGLLDESECKEILLLAKEFPEIQDEINEIEKAMIQLSSSFSRNIPTNVYDKIKSAIFSPHTKSVDIHSHPYFNFKSIASICAILGLAIFGLNYYLKFNETKMALSHEIPRLNHTIDALSAKNSLAERVISVMKDSKNRMVLLAGQTVSPSSYAKVYWNQSTKSVYIDASGLPTPPEGKVYQVWALKLNPLTPTSIGLLDKFASNDLSFFELNATESAEAFGITLEPAGGCASPTMEQLYTLGQI